MAEVLNYEALINEMTDSEMTPERMVEIQRTLSQVSRADQTQDYLFAWKEIYETANNKIAELAETSLENMNLDDLKSLDSLLETFVSRTNNGYTGVAGKFKANIDERRKALEADINPQPQPEAANSEEEIVADNRENEEKPETRSPTPNEDVPATDDTASSEDENEIKDHDAFYSEMTSFDLKQSYYDLSEKLANSQNNGISPVDTGLISWEIKKIEEYVQRELSEITVDSQNAPIVKDYTDILSKADPQYKYEHAAELEKALIEFDRDNSLDGEIPSAEKINDNKNRWKEISSGMSSAMPQDAADNINMTILQLSDKQTTAETIKVLHTTALIELSLEEPAQDAEKAKQRYNEKLQEVTAQYIANFERNVAVYPESLNSTYLLEKYKKDYNISPEDFAAIQKDNAKTKEFYDAFAEYSKVQENIYNKSVEEYLKEKKISHDDWMNADENSNIKQGFIRHNLVKAAQSVNVAYANSLEIYTSRMADKSGMKKSPSEVSQLKKDMTRSHSWLMKVADAVVKKKDIAKKLGKNALISGAVMTAFGTVGLTVKQAVDLRKDFLNSWHNFARQSENDISIMKVRDWKGFRNYLKQNPEERVNLNQKTTSLLVSAGATAAIITTTGLTGGLGLAGGAVAGLTGAAAQNAATAVIQGVAVNKLKAAANGIVALGFGSAKYTQKAKQIKPHEEAMKDILRKYAPEDNTSAKKFSFFGLRKNNDPVKNVYNDITSVLGDQDKMWKKLEDFAPDMTQEDKVAVLKLANTIKDIKSEAYTIGTGAALGAAGAAFVVDDGAAKVTNGIQSLLGNDNAAELQNVVETPNPTAAVTPVNTVTNTTDEVMTASPDTIEKIDEINVVGHARVHDTYKPDIKEFEALQKEGAQIVREELKNMKTGAQETDTATTGPEMANFTVNGEAVTVPDANSLEDNINGARDVYLNRHEEMDYGNYSAEIKADGIDATIVAKTEDITHNSAVIGHESDVQTNIKSADLSMERHVQTTNTDTGSATLNTTEGVYGNGNNQGIPEDAKVVGSFDFKNDNTTIHVEQYEVKDAQTGEVKSYITDGAGHVRETHQDIRDIYQNGKNLLHETAVTKLENEQALSADSHDLKADTETKADTEIKNDAKDDVKTDTKVDDKADTETKADEKADAKVDDKVDTETKADTKVDEKADDKADEKADAKADAKVDDKADDKVDAKPNNANENAQPVPDNSADIAMHKTSDGVKYQIDEAGNATVEAYITYDGKGTLNSSYIQHLMPQYENKSQHYGWYYDDLAATYEDKNGTFHCGESVATDRYAAKVTERTALQNIVAANSVYNDLLAKDSATLSAGEQKFMQMHEATLEKRGLVNQKGGILEYKNCPKEHYYHKLHDEVVLSGEDKSQAVSYFENRAHNAGINGKLTTSLEDGKIISVGKNGILTTNEKGAVNAYFIEDGHIFRYNNTATITKQELEQVKADIAKVAGKDSKLLADMNAIEKLGRQKFPEAPTARVMSDNVKNMTQTNGKTNS